MLGLITSLLPAMGIGAALGGFASKQTQKSQWQEQEEQSRRRTEEQTGLRQTLEPEYFTQFRQELIRRMLEELMATPMPSQQQYQATMLNQLNQLSMDAARAAREALARTGRLNSGLAESTIARMEMDRAARQAEFLANSPMLYAQQRQAALLPYLNLGAQWTGAAPTSESYTGRNIVDELVRSSREGKSSGSSGVPWWRSTLGGLGGAFGNIFLKGLWG